MVWSCGSVGQLATNAKLKCQEVIHCRALIPANTSDDKERTVLYIRVLFRTLFRCYETIAHNVLPLIYSWRVSLI